VILVFGAGGQVGQQLLATARATGIAIAGFKHTEVDVADRAAVERTVNLIRPSIIVNAAAYNAVDLAESEPDAAKRTNTDAPGILAEVAHAADVPMVHLSTDYVFDGKRRRPYEEGDDTAPLGVYGRTKADGEMAVRVAHPEHFILRTAWVFGPYGDNTLTKVLRLAAEKDELAFVADQTGSPTPAADLAEAILVLARRPREHRVPGTYHVAGPDPATRYEVASEIVAAQHSHTGRSAVVRSIAAIDFHAAASRPTYSVLDSSKFATAFGFRVGDWKRGVHAAVAQFFSAARAS
jgi:dTDP-4-dehydrorhamnose reductase